MTQVNEHIEFDTSDVDRRVGPPVGAAKIRADELRRLAAERLAGSENTF
jgi:hypothetical protein